MTSATIRKGTSERKHCYIHKERDKELTPAVALVVALEFGVVESLMALCEECLKSLEKGEFTYIQWGFMAEDWREDEEYMAEIRRKR